MLNKYSDSDFIELMRSANKCEQFRLMAFPNLLIRL